MNIVRRLDTEWRNRGTAGFVRFIALRVVQRRADVLFEYDLTQLQVDDESGSDTVVVVDRHNFGSAATAAVEQEILTGGNHAYVEELQGAGQLLAATDRQGRVTSYAFIVFESFYKKILGESNATPIISNCLTFPANRGAGLYPLVLRTSLRHLAAQGYSRAIITCAPDNFASVRGIEKAGFRRVKTIHSLIIFARWIVAQRADFSSSPPLSESAA